MTKEFGNSDILDTFAATGSKVEPEIEKINSGWLSGERPAYQYMNWVQNTLFKQINYLMRSGIPEWNASTEYLANDVTTYNGITYTAVNANNNSQPPSADWSTGVTAADHGSLTGLTDDDHTQYLLLSGRTGQQITDDITLVGDFTIGLNDVDGYTVFNQSAKKLKLTLPSDDGTNFFQILDSNGNLVFSINSDAVIQSELADPLTLIDPLRLTNELFFNTAKTIYFETLDGNNLFERITAAGLHVLDLQADNDGTSGFSIQNSDGKTTFGAYSNGLTEITVPIESAATFPVHIMDFAGQGTAIGGQTVLVETYTDKGAVFRGDSVMQGGAIFYGWNGTNSVRRPDLAPTFVGTSDFLQFGNATDGTFYLFLDTKEQLWLDDSPMQWQHNGTGSGGFNFRTFQTNPYDFRMHNPTGYIDFHTFDNGGEDGLEYLVSSTALGGFRINVSNGELNLLATEDISITSTTGVVSIQGIVYPSTAGAAGSFLEFDGSGNVISILPAYGEAYQTDNVTATTINTVNVWEEIDNFTTGESQGVTVSTGTLTVNSGQSGVYSVAASISGVPSAVNKTFEFAVSVNDVVQTKTKQSRYFSSVTSAGLVSLHGTVALSDSDVVKLEIRNITDDTDFTVNNSNFFIHRID